MAERRAGPAPTGWQRPLEWLLFAGPAAAGACLVGLGLAAGRAGERPLDVATATLVGRPALALAVVAVLVLVGGAWTVGLAAALYLDAEALAAEPTSWDPRGSAHAALVLVVPPAALHYLHRRHRRVQPAEAVRWWWLGLALTVLALAVPIVGARRGVIPPAAVLAGQGLALALLPAAAYRDAAYVRELGGGWRPDPALHYVVAAVAALLALPVPLYVGYYLLRRGRATRRA